MAHTLKKNRWMIAFTVIMLAVVEVLDITIVSVALLNMKGALSASPDQITWTITVYVISAAIFMPLTGFLTTRFGRKRLLFLSALGFGAASLLCGFAHTLGEMLLFRGLQGVFGALLPALAQSTLLETFEGPDLNKAMAFFGIGIMIGPILGPVLGGYITDTIGWRWIFFVNVPVCLVAAILTWFFLDETKTRKVKTDWMGLGLLALAVGTLQFVLDKGNEDGWLQSHTIQIAIVVALFAWVVFIVRGLSKRDHVITFALFKDKNYTLACTAMLLYCAVMLGVYSWLPLWLEIFMHYPAIAVGLVLMPRGIACLLIMMVSPFLLKKVDARVLVAVACVIYAIGSFMMTHYNLYVSPETVMIPNILQGFATGFFFVPLTALAYQSLDKRYMDEASGLFNFGRSLGSSIGVAVFSTIMSQMAQVNWHSLTRWLNPFNPQLQHWLQVNNLSIHSPMAQQRLQDMLTAQAHMLAFNDGNWLFSFLMLCLVPLVWFIDKHKAREIPMGH